ncbi:CatA-like O-acetyltransferase, partial [Staphylococcus aureus]|uniref:CatA-like O-acetyltransferase n=1 Tax=Staphylococcus aureus TaxID=1280 RepID=UPI001FD02A25
LEPLYTIFDGVSKTFSGIWTPVKNDFKEFYDLYLSDVEKYNGCLLYTSKKKKRKNKKRKLIHKQKRRQESTHQKSQENLL